MAESTINFRFAIDFTILADAMRNVEMSAQHAAQAFRDADAAINPMWATLPGAWPDQFTLLNRYLRTGVKPEWLFNE